MVGRPGGRPRAGGPAHQWVFMTLGGRCPPIKTGRNAWPHKAARPTPAGIYRKMGPRRFCEAGPALHRHSCGSETRRGVAADGERRGTQDDVNTPAATAIRERSTSQIMKL